MDEFYSDLAYEIECGPGGYLADGYDLGEVFVTCPNGDKYVLSGQKVDKFPTED